MVIKTLSSFPTYGFREDGRIVNLKTKFVLRNKPHLKLLDENGLRQSINTQRLFKELFPEKFGKPTTIRYLTKYNQGNDAKPFKAKVKPKGNSDVRPIKIVIKKVIVHIKP